MGRNILSYPERLQESDKTSERGLLSAEKLSGSG